jgi:transcriptional regulator GlxA family with amidase domain
MQVAIAVYPRFTALDVFGPYEVLGRMPGVDVVFVAETCGRVVNDLGDLTLDVSASFADVQSPDVVLVGGGPGQVDQIAGSPLPEWLKQVDQTSTWTTSVCTGALILAAAGLLDGRKATSHWGAMAQLGALGAIPSDQRVVIDGKFVTAAGVSAGVDMALTLVGLLHDDDEAQMIQLILEYAPEPPYSAGSLHSAPRHVVEGVMERMSARFASY